MEKHELMAELTKKYRWKALDAELWIEEEFRCTYCGRNLLNSLEGYRLGQKDHILPRSKYPQLAETRSNLALACQVCNFFKSRWDANENGPPVYREGTKLTEAQRRKLLARCRCHVEHRRIEKTKKVLEIRRLVWRFQHGEQGAK
ncbi:MAG: HNH endonuclease [Planctomycetota bacterium]|jgi:hypothetical protein